jgi:hypothetical protein
MRACVFKNDAWSAFRTQSYRVVVVVVVVVVDVVVKALRLDWKEMILD